MSQLNTAIQTLVDEHGTFITKAEEYHARKGAARSQAVEAATGAEQAQAAAEGAETTTDLHEAAALAAFESARDDQRAAHAAKRQAEQAVLEAKRARLHAEAVAAGDLDRYTQWLLDSPVAQGTMHLTFANQSYQVWEDGRLQDKTFSEALTFTRATPKWVWNSTGTLVEVPVDQPTYDHDPVTGEPLGVLIEQSRTNIITDSISFSQFSRIGTLGTVTPDEKFGTAIFLEATETTYSNNGVFGAGYLVPSDSSDPTWTRSMFIKKGTSRYFSIGKGHDGGSEALRVDLDSDFVSSDDGVTVGDGHSFGAKDVGGGWFRVWVAGSAGSSYFNRRFSFNFHNGSRTFGSGHQTMGSGESGWVAGIQLEKGSYPTSYIPTNGAPVTRAADNMSRDLGAEFNPSAGTLFIDLSHFNPDSFSYDVNHVLSIGGGTSSNFGFLFNRPGYTRYSDKFYFQTRGTPAGSDSGNASVPSSSRRIAASFDVATGRVSLAADGISAGDRTFNLSPVPLPANLSNNNRGGSPLQVTHKAVRYYPYAMTEAELEELTAL